MRVEPERSERGSRERFAPAFRVLSARIALPLLVAASAALEVARGRAWRLPAVFGDELIYSGLGKSFATGGRFLVRGHVDLGHSILYPVLISPAYALSRDGAAAFAAVKVINAVSMSLTAVPTYFLARRVASQRWSLAVAALSVLVPWMSYTARVMTESAFYPLFVAFALSLVRALEQPSARRQLVAVSALVALGSVRPQAVVLAPAVVTAVVLDGACAGSFRLTIARFWPSWAAFVGLASAWVAIRVAVSHPLSAYGALARSYDPVSLFKWALWNLADLELAVGVAAFVAFLLVLTRLLGRSATRGERAVGSVALSCVVWMLASVAVLSASPYGLDRLHERSFFYVTPLLLACLAHWLSRGMPRSPRSGAIVGVAAFLLPLTLPSRQLLSDQWIDAPATVPWLHLKAFLRVHHILPGLPLVVVVALAVGAALTLFFAVRAPAVLLLTALAAFVATTAVTGPSAAYRKASPGRLAWLDRALPGSGRAMLVFVGSPCMTHWETDSMDFLFRSTEFFNTKVDRVAVARSSISIGALATDRLRVGAGGILLDGARPVRAAYVALDSRLHVEGTPIASRALRDIGVGTARDTPGALTLWRTRGSVRIVDSCRG